MGVKVDEDTGKIVEDNKPPKRVETDSCDCEEVKNKDKKEG